MKNNSSCAHRFCGIILVGFFVWSPTPCKAEQSSAVAKAMISSNETGWRELAEKDFANVNCKPDTFTWSNGVIHCTGQPIGVLRTQTVYTNFEMVAQWRHLKAGGNSGFYVWATPESIAGLEKGINAPFPSGIEVQVLDHGYTEQYEKDSKQKATWFTTNGDVFPVGSSKMKPFPPISPDGSRSFPRKNLSKGAGEWNQYYVRCFNGEVRLWVNGEEVSGGNNCKPASGYVCIESEGAPIDFKEIRIRELP